MKRTKHYRIKIIFIIASVLLLSLSIFSYFRISSILDSSALANHTNNVKLGLENLFSSLKEAESNQRGFVITNDSAFLKKMNHSLVNIDLQFAKLDSLTIKKPSQQEQIAILKRLSDQKIDFIQENLKANLASNPSSETSISAETNRDDLRIQIDKMMAAEDLLIKPQKRSLIMETTLTPFLTILLVISILILITSYYLNTKELLEANISLQKSNQENALSQYNKRFLLEFSERFSNYKVHNEFFNSLVKYIADITQMDYVLVGKIEHTPDNQPIINTIAIASSGELIHNISYPLQDGSSEKVIAREAFFFPEKCQQLFPEDETLKKFNIEGYVGYPLYASDATPIGLIAVMHKQNIEDPEGLTAILKIVAKRAEMELERTKNEELLAQKNISLIEKNESLAKMNKELESFTYVSSHDLQEPLRKIQTFITRIIEKEYDSLSENGKNYLNRTQDAANRMQNLIRDLLAYSRLKIEIFPYEKTNLNSIVDEVQTDLLEELSEKNATIEINGSAEVKIIVSQFRQLLTNLISNSVKFSKPDQPLLISIQNTIVKGSDVTIVNILPDINYTQLCISDNGVGFDSQYKDRIFEVFQRLHTNQQYAGTGIGLAIVKKIVDNHNGFITADGAINEGASFTIYLPA